MIKTLIFWFVLRDLYVSALLGIFLLIFYLNFEPSRFAHKTKPFAVGVSTEMI